MKMLKYKCTNNSSDKLCRYIVGFKGIQYCKNADENQHCVHICKNESYKESDIDRRINVLDLNYRMTHRNIEITKDKRRSKSKTYPIYKFIDEHITFISRTLGVVLSFIPFSNIRVPIEPYPSTMTPGYYLGYTVLYLSLVPIITILISCVYKLLIKSK